MLGNQKILYGICLLGCFIQSYVTASSVISKKAIVIGASSGMGREVAKLLSKEGYAVGLVARRLPLLESLQEELQNPSYSKQLDVTAPNAREKLQELIDEMGGLDLIVISISAYLDNRRGWTERRRTLLTDSIAFIAIADAVFEYFIQQNSGHFVGISSTSGIRGSAANPVYSGAKACIMYYMEGMRNYMIQNNINVQVTDIIPGFVAVEHSPLGQDPSAYCEITCEQAGQEIVAAIKAKKKTAIIPGSIWWVAVMLKYMPDWMYNNYFSWM